MKKKQPYSPSFFQEILELLDEGVFVLTIPENKIVFSNQKFCKISGYTNDELLSSEITSIAAGKVNQQLNHLIQNKQSPEAPETQSIDGGLITKSGKCLECNWKSQRLTVSGTTFLVIKLTEIKVSSKSATTPGYGLNPYQKLLNYINVGIFHADLTGRFLFVNNEMAKIGGFYNVAEVMSLSARQLFSEVSYRKKIEEIIIQQNEIKNAELNCHKKDGAEYWVTVNAVLIKDNRGNPESILGFVRDITEKRKVEENLKTNRSNLQAILDNFPFLAWLKDSEGKFIAVNTPFAKSCNVSSPDELVGKTDLDVWPKELAENYRKDDLEVIRSKKNKNVEELISDKGIEKWFETFKAPLFDMTGNVIGTTGFSRDITGRKSVEEAIQASEKRFRALIDNSTEAISVISATGTVLYASPNVPKINGYDTDSRLGKDGFETVVPEDLPLIKTIFSKLIMNPGEIVTNIQFRAVRKDGSIWWAEASAANLLDDPSVRGIVINYRDITIRKNFELQLRESEAKFSRAFVQSPVSLSLSTMKDSRYIDVNDSFLFSLGFTRDEVIGKTPLELNLWENHNDRERVLEMLKKNGFVRGIELPIRAKNKKILTTIFSAEFIQIGKEQCLLTSALDITSRKVIEDALKESEEKLSSFLNNFQGIAYQMLCENENCDSPLLFKGTVSVITGYSIEDFTNNRVSWNKLIFSEDKVAYSDERKKVISNPGYISALRYRIINKDGTLRWVHDISYLLQPQENTIVQGTINDITDQKNLEERLQYFKSAVEFSANAVGMATPDGKHWYNNSALVELFGDIGTDSPISLYVNQDVGKEVFATIMGGREWKGEVEMYSKNHQVLNIVLHAYPIKDEAGNIVGLVGVHIDITDNKKAEAELIKSKKSLEEAQEKVHMGSWDLNLTVGKGNWSKEMFNIFRRDPDLGAPPLNEFPDYIHPDDRQRILDAQNRMIEKGDEHIGEFRTNPDHGEIKIIHIHYFPKRNKQGKAISLFGTALDITEQRRAEEKILKSEKQYRLIAENATDVIWILDTSIGYFTYVSPSVERLRGMTPEQVITQEFTDALTPASQKYLQEIIPGRVADFQGGVKKVYFDEIEQTCADGTTVWTETTTKFAEDETSGHILVYGVSRNIKERKKAEQELKERESYLQKAFEIATIGPWKYDIVNNKYDWTKSSLEVLGFDPDNIPVTYQDFQKFIHPEDLEDVDKEVQKSILTKKFEFEHRILVGDKIKWVRVKSHIETDNKRNDAFSIGIIQDITKQKSNELALLKQNQEYLSLNEEYLAQNEELIESLDRIQKINQEYEDAKKRAEESDRLKTAFLANMSHEIRTPMNGIIGFTELLKEPKLDGEQQQRYIEVIQRSGQRMLNIINDLIDISKIEAGQTEIYLECINLNYVFDNLFAFFMPEAEMKGFKFDYRKGLPDSECTILTDETKLNQILSNLIKNSIKYTSAGFIKFGYELEFSSEKGTNLLKFYVRDSGIGIKPELKEKIFERFHQGDLVYSKSYEGAGLGLSISKAFVEMLGGEIWVESETENFSIGKTGGSSFYFTLPYIQYNSKIADKTHSGKPQIETFSEKTLLIVEDDNVSYLYLKEMLSGKGIKLLNAGNGIEAIKLVKANPGISLVLMDIKMPEMNGLEATKVIKQLRPELPIIAQTAFASQLDEQNCYDAGCVDYISKPILRDVLLAKISKYFE